MNLAAVGVISAGDHVEQRRLAGAVRPDHADNLVLAHCASDAGKRAHPAE
jgi:hypothetical protein